MGFTFTFPGGKIRQERITDGAGNAATNKITVPTGKRWLLMSVRIKLVNDATVANRFPYLKITDATDILWESGTFTATASATYTINFSTDGGAVQRIAYTTVNGAQAFGLQILKAGDVLDFTVTTGQAGDVLNVWVRVLEMDA